MTLQWETNPVETIPYVQYGSVVTVRGIKDLGGGENRAITVATNWGGESNSPAESVLFADVEAIWDSMVTAGYTITDAYVENPGGIMLPFNFEKA